MDETVPSRREPQFSFGVREIEQGNAAAEPGPADPQFLTVDDEDRGFDPYNSTGRFDRNNAWSRVRRR